jgi:hypothetical protein
MSDSTNMNKGFLKDKLGNYQVAPPEKVWNNISGQIGKGRKKRGLYILLLASAASIALVISLGIRFFGPDLPQQGAVTEELQPAGELPGDSLGDQAGESEVSKLEQKVAETLSVLNSEGTDRAATEKEPEPGQEAIALDQAVLSNPEPVYKPEPAVEPEETDPEAVEPETTDPEAIIDSKVTADLAASADTVALLQLDEADENITAPFQDLEADTRKESRWMVGAALSPLYSFRDAEAGAIPDDPAETGMLSYSTGVHVSYRRNSRFAIETGIYYNRTGISIGAPGIEVFSQDFDNLMFGKGSEVAEIRTVGNTIGNIVAYSGDIYMNRYKINAENASYPSVVDQFYNVQESELGLQQHLDYLELPINLRYSVIDRNIELQLVGGMSTNFLVNNYVTRETSSGKEEIGYLSNVRAINYSGNAGLGMIYHMGQKISLMLEPRFRYFINSVNDSSLPSTRPFSLGLYTGLSYTF